MRTPSLTRNLYAPGCVSHEDSFTSACYIIKKSPGHLITRTLATPSLSPNLQYPDVVSDVTWNRSNGQDCERSSGAWATVIDS